MIDQESIVKCQLKAFGSLGLMDLRRKMSMVLGKEITMTQIKIVIKKMRDNGQLTITQNNKGFMIHLGDK